MGYVVNRNEEFPFALKTALDGDRPAVIEITVSDKDPSPWETAKIE